MFSFGQHALIGMISHLFFIAITWRVIQTVNFDPIIRKGRVIEARLLLLFLTIVIGTGVSRFFLDFLTWSQNLSFLFG